MPQESKERDQSCSRHPKSLGSLYSITQNACKSIQQSLNALRKQILSLNIDKEDDYVTEILDHIETYESDLNLVLLSDAQCQLLAEDFDLGVDEQIVTDILKKLRDLDLLRSNADTFFTSMSKRLSLILDDGLYVFCVSLIEITNEEVDEISGYDDFIAKQRNELFEGVMRLKDHEDRWRNLTIDTRLALNNVEGLRACLEDINAQWDVIRGGIDEWIRRDRYYPSQLDKRITQNRDTTRKLLLEADRGLRTDQLKKDELKHRKQQMVALRKRRRELCNDLERIERARRYNSSKLAANESAEANGAKSKGQSLSRSNRATSVSKSQEAFYRQRDSRLEKEYKEVKSSLSNVEKKISELKQQIAEDEESVSAGSGRQSEIRVEIAQMEKVSSDCREVLLQRGKVQTFIKLRKGPIAKPQRGGTAFYQACRFVARRVGHEWPRLYLHLPMWPERSRDQREEDVSGLLGFKRMNVVLPRNRTCVEEARAGLEKWRLLSRRHVDVEGLASGLRLAGWAAWAHEVRRRWGERTQENPLGSEEPQREGEVVEDSREPSEVVSEHKEVDADQVDEEDSDENLDMVSEDVEEHFEPNEGQEIPENEPEDEEKPGESVKENGANQVDVDGSSQKPPKNEECKVNPRSLSITSSRRGSKSEYESSEKRMIDQQNLEISTYTPKSNSSSKNLDEQVDGEDEIRADTNQKDATEEEQNSQEIRASEPRETYSESSSSERVKENGRGSGKTDSKNAPKSLSKSSENWVESKAQKKPESSKKKGEEKRSEKEINRGGKSIKKDALKVKRDELGVKQSKAESISNEEEQKEDNRGEKLSKLESESGGDSSKYDAEDFSKQENIQQETDDELKQEEEHNKSEQCKQKEDNTNNDIKEDENPSKSDDDDDDDDDDGDDDDDDSDRRKAEMDVKKNVAGNDKNESPNILNDEETEDTESVASRKASDAAAEEARSYEKTKNKSKDDKKSKKADASKGKSKKKTK